MQQPSTYRTEPFAIWGFVLAFLFWPVGIVLSFVGLRRIRRSGDHGYGLAVAGAALSIIFAVASVVGVLVSMSSAGVFDRWRAKAAESAERQKAEQLVDRKVSEAEHGLQRQHDSGEPWPADTSMVMLGTAQGVWIVAYRNGDELCVEGTYDGVTASLTDETTERDVTCPDRGFPDTLQDAADKDNGVGDQAAVAAQVDEMHARGDALAKDSHDAETSPDPNYTWSGQPAPPMDDDLFAACAAMSANAEQATDPVSRLALGRLAAGYLADADHGFMDDLTDQLEWSARTGDTANYEALLRSGLRACWAAGFDPPGDAVPPND